MRRKSIYGQRFRDEVRNAYNKVFPSGANTDPSKFKFGGLVPRGWLSGDFHYTILCTLDRKKYTHAEAVTRYQELRDEPYDGMTLSAGKWTFYNRSERDTIHDGSSGFARDLYRFDQSKRRSVRRG